MDLDDGGVDQGVFQIWIIRDGVEQPLPDLRLHPVAKAGEDAVPVPEQGWQIAPGTAGAHNPQHRLDKQAIVLAAAPWITGLAQTTRFHLRPLGVRQHKAVHPSREAQPSTDEKRESQQALVLPTGYAFNLDGTSLYMSMGVLFLSNAYNVPLDFSQQLGTRCCRDPTGSTRGPIEVAGQPSV